MSGCENSPRPMTIAVDFDGTIVSHAYPEIGRDLGAVAVLKALQARGHRLILLTMRCRLNQFTTGDAQGLVDAPAGDYLADAVRWCRDRGLTFWAVNNNPEQSRWTTSRKVYANMYIDDAALGIPLLQAGESRPFVDWEAVEHILKTRGVL